MTDGPSRRLVLASGVVLAVSGCVTDDEGSGRSGSDGSSSPSTPAERRPADSVGRTPDGILACWQLAVSDDGRQVAATTRHGVTIWTIADGTHVRDIPCPGTGVVAWSPDGTLLAASSDDTDIRLIEAATGTERATLSGHDAADVGISITGLAFSPDGSTLVSTGEDGTVRRWSVKGSTTSTELRSGEKDPQAVAFSPDGARLAVVGLAAAAQVSDAKGSGAEAVGEGPARGCAIAWSPDGDLLAIGTEDDAGQGTVRVHDARTLEEKEVSPGDVRANAVAFSPDGTKVAVADGRITATVAVWELATSEVTRLEGHDRPPYSLVWVDEKTLVSTSDFDGVIVWNPATGEELRRLTP